MTVFLKQNHRGMFKVVVKFKYINGLCNIIGLHCQFKRRHRIPLSIYSLNSVCDFAIQQSSKIPTHISHVFTLYVVEY